MITAFQAYVRGKSHTPVNELLPNGSVTEDTAVRNHELLNVLDHGRPVHEVADYITVLTKKLNYLEFTGLQRKHGNVVEITAAHNHQYYTIYNHIEIAETGARFQVLDLSDPMKIVARFLGVSTNPSVTITEVLSTPAGHIYISPLRATWDFNSDGKFGILGFNGFYIRTGYQGGGSTNYNFNVLSVHTTERGANLKFGEIISYNNFSSSAEFGLLFQREQSHSSYPFETTWVYSDVSLNVYADNPMVSSGYIPCLSMGIIRMSDDRYYIGGGSFFSVINLTEGTSAKYESNLRYAKMTGPKTDAIYEMSDPWFPEFKTGCGNRGSFLESSYDGSGRRVQQTTVRRLQDEYATGDHRIALVISVDSINANKLPAVGTLDIVYFLGENLL